MKRIVAALFPLLALVLPARSQIIISDNMMVGRLTEIRASIVDSLTNEPVPFASVYLIPSKDTTITNFTLSDAEGRARLDDIPYGSYSFHVEMLGYKPYVKERYFRDRRVDMGVIRLAEDELFLEAAVVSDVGNPIIIKKDTVEFNASSYRVGSNAMLKDLLKRMPGMEITEDGKVKFNGESIDKLTVGGRTFFFGDQQTALNNLPAAVVDKIRVIDRDSEKARATGISDGQKEKILDVGLKKEYEKGWFGNAGAKAGATLSSNDSDELRDRRGLLYSGNVLASAYNEKDQLTLIGNAQNVNDGDAVFVVYGLGGGAVTSIGSSGLSSAAQAGVNLNTTRIKDVETTVGANYNYTDTESASRSTRTTFQDDGDLLSNNEDASRYYENSVKTQLEMKKEKGDVWFTFSPSASWSRTHRFGNGSSDTSRDGISMNSSSNNTESLDNSVVAQAYGSVNFRRLGGKDGRVLRLEMNGGVSSSGGGRNERSVLSTAAGESVRTLSYDSSGGNTGVTAGIDYTEPLSDKFSVNTGVSFQWNKDKSVSDAFDKPGVRNEYYSSESNSMSMHQTYRLTAQYKFNQLHTLTLGATTNGILNETFSKTFGVSQITGKDEWNWFLNPVLRYTWSPEAGRLRVSVSGSGSKPSNSLMLPVLNVADPSRLSMGNIYLRPSSSTNASITWSGSRRERFSSLMAYLTGGIQTNPVTYARWYDKDGVMNSIPINTRKPTLNTSLYVSHTRPLDKKKELTISVSGNISVSSSTSYQPGKILDGVDKSTFDYTEFMNSFWGPDESGSRFYSGESGFSESTTTTLMPNVSLRLNYNRERWNLSASSSVGGHIARYSLDPSMNLSTMDSNIGLEGSYITKHEFEFKTSARYVFHTGYADGYGTPELRWNAEVDKSVGAFVLSLKVNDILDQTKNLYHTVNANYMEDTYRLIMGRCFLFGVKWNFGKMNRSNSRIASQAAWGMAL